MEAGTSYFGVRDVRAVERDLDRFAERGLDAVLHTFSERDGEYYEETMGDIVAASRERGFTTYVNPWGVGRVFGGEAFSEFVGRHPDACQRLSTGDRIPAACFNAPAFRDYAREWVESAVGTGADVVFWDEPGWAGPGEEHADDAYSCRCAACRERYREQYDEPMPAAETDRVRAFREDSLIDFLREVMDEVHALGAENAVCLLPVDGPHGGVDDWERLARSDSLDVFATDPYWDALGHPVEPFVRKQADRVTSLADEHDVRSQLWIQGFGLSDDPETIEAVGRATRIAVDSGADSVFTWGWDGCRVISSISSEDPEAVWEAYLSELP